MVKLWPVNGHELCHLSWVSILRAIHGLFMAISSVVFFTQVSKPWPVGLLFTELSARHMIVAGYCRFTFYFSFDLDNKSKNCGAAKQYFACANHK